MSRSTCLYAAALLAPLAASLTLFALLPAPPVAIEVVDASFVPPAPLFTQLPDCADAPPAPAAPADEAPSVAPAPVRDPGAAVLLHDRHLVLASVPEMTWSSGQPKIRALADGLTVAYDLARDVVPADLQAQAGARFTLFSGDGTACLADAGDLTIHGQMDGVFLFDEAPPSRDELHETATSMQPDDHVVQAPARGPRGCSGVWARRADLPEPAVFGRRKADARERAEVRRLLDAQPGIVALRADFTEYHSDMPDAADWSAFVRDTLELSAWHEVGGERRYVLAQVGSDADGCDGFGERAAVLFLRDGDALVPQPGPGFLDPLAVMDIDRDGQLEAVTDHGRALESRAADSPLATRYAFPSLGCGC